jgi:predicted enzyme related to lactoylglutathione lyase
MHHSPGAGAVLYAADAARVSAFYSAVIGLQVVHADHEYTLLRSEAFELVILVTADARAVGATLTDPPQRRNQAAFKPVFFVPDLPGARELAGQFGGSLNPADREWRFQDFIVCDGVDPEGNVFQLRQPAE